MLEGQFLPCYFYKRIIRAAFLVEDDCPTYRGLVNEGHAEPGSVSVGVDFEVAGRERHEGDGRVCVEDIV